MTIVASRYLTEHHTSKAPQYIIGELQLNL